MRFIATVLTNGEDDIYRRVKLKADTIFEESELIPSVNGISLSEGDTVLVDCEGEDITNSIILGRIRTKQQVGNDPQSEDDGVIIYQHKSEAGWSVLKALGNSLYFENSEGVKATVIDSSITLVVPTDSTVSIEGNSTLSVKGDSSISIEGKADVSVKGSTSIKADGNVDVQAGSDISLDCSGTVSFKATKEVIDAMLECTHAGVPDGKGPYCGVPMCLFSGAPHSASKTS